MCYWTHSSNNLSKSISFIVDGNVVKAVDLELDCMPKTVDVPLGKGGQLKITSDYSDFTNTPSSYGIANMTIK